MTILKILDPIRKKMPEMEIGDILRQTRDALGIKQWLVAKWLNINCNQLKEYEYNRIPARS